MIDLLALSLILFILICISLFVIVKNTSKRAKISWPQVAIAGSAILSLVQLMGILFGTWIPLYYGPDLSDYSLSCDPIYHNLVYDSLSHSIQENENYKIDYDSNGTILFVHLISKIRATNYHPLKPYNRQILLKTGNNYDSFIVTLSEPVIDIKNYSIIDINLSNISELFPAKYPVTIKGIGSDGKERSCTITIEKSLLCFDECLLGSRRCNESGNEILICGNFDNDPCSEWSKPQPCGSGYVCNSGSCVAYCSDECIPKQKRCSSNNSTQICGNFDDDPCSEWSEPQPCGSCGLDS